MHVMKAVFQLWYGFLSPLNTSVLTCLSCFHMSCTNSSLSELVFSFFSASSFFSLLFLSLSSFSPLLFLSLSSFLLSSSSFVCLTIEFLLDNNSLVSSACSPSSSSPLLFHLFLDSRSTICLCHHLLYFSLNLDIPLLPC